MAHARRSQRPLRFVRWLPLVAGALTLIACSPPRPPQPLPPTSARAEPPASRPDASVESYRAAERTGANGALVGKIYAQRRKPDSADLPLAGTLVSLLPYSEPLKARLEALKNQSRESMTDFREAVPRIRRVRDAYETALWESGAGDLVLSARAGTDGTFRVESVPAGRWLLVAWRSEYVPRMGTATSPEEQAVFGYSPRLAGFYRVALWLREVNVSRTSADPLELTDRGVWFNGIAEDWDAFPAPRRRLQSQ